MKLQVSQDALYEYLLEHNVKFSLLAKMMGVCEGTVSGCFRHELNRHGKPMKFSAANIEKLNAAIAQLAESLRGCLLTFGSDKVFTNKWNRTYDPSQVEPIKRGVGRYFKLEPFLKRTLGWGEKKKEQILISPSSKVYGNVSAADVQRINAEILAVVGVLSSYEVVADAAPAAASQVAASRAHKKKDVRARKADAFSAPPQPWDDTSRTALDRYSDFKAEYPDGVLFFRVLSGYTVAQDDTRIVASIDATLKPWTDITTGFTTTYMKAEVFDRLLPQLVSRGHRIAVTNMYDKERG